MGKTDRKRVGCIDMNIVTIPKSIRSRVLSSKRCHRSARVLIVRIHRLVGFHGDDRRLRCVNVPVNPAVMIAQFDLKFTGDSSPRSDNQVLMSSWLVELLICSLSSSTLWSH